MWLSFASLLQSGRRCMPNGSHLVLGNGMKISRTIIGLNFVIYLALVLAVWAAPSGHFVLVLTDPTQKNRLRDLSDRSCGWLVRGNRTL